jgi:pimeloyl-ACP methyl ester carboxylesterase
MRRGHEFCGMNSEARRESATKQLVLGRRFQAAAVQQTPPEMIINSWITAARERRRVKAVAKLLDFKRWEERANGSLYQSHSIKVFLSVLMLMAFLCGNDARVAAKSLAPDLARDAGKHSTFNSPPVEDHFVTIESVRVHYIDIGTGHTVVMIHGNAGSVEDFKFGALALLSSEYRVVAIDRPGHGSSDRPKGETATVEFQAELLHRTLASLGITEPTLVGHSWGAALALAYALKYPHDVSAIVLLAPAAYPDDCDNGLVRAIVRTPVISDLSLVLARAILGHRLLRKALARAFYPQPLPNAYIRLANSLWLRKKQLKAYIEDESTLNHSLKRMSSRYSEINIPVVIVTGDKDQIVSPDQNAYALHAAIPQSQLIRIKDEGHEIPLTRPESIETALKLVDYNRQVAEPKHQSRQIEK